MDQQYPPPPPPPPSPSVGPGAATGSLPSVGLTVVVTALFGLFGLIPASIHAARAQRLGVGGGRYWKAFGWTLGASIVVWGAATAALLVFVILAGPSVAPGTVLLQASGTSGTDSSGPSASTFVPEGDLEVSYTIQCTTDGRAPDVGIAIGLDDTAGTYAASVAAEQRFTLVGGSGTGSVAIDEDDLGDLEGESAVLVVNIVTIGATCSWDATVTAA